jgi:hypothetical protein
VKLKIKKIFLTTAIPLLITSQVQGFEFYTSELEGSFNSQLSLGSSWRVESQDKLLTSDGNEEDGNSNFYKGDTFSQIFKGNHDLHLSYKNFGALVRGKYWYDSALADNNVNYGHTPTAEIGTGPTTPLEVDHAGNSRLDDSDFNKYAKFSGATLLDAYAYAEFELADIALDLRLGKQVVSWGESTFILGGINSINPVDVNAFTRPGSEIKEGLLPVNMAYANLGLSDNISAEVFYQLEFQETIIPGCGTYFATNDFISEGCNIATLEQQDASLQRDDNGIREAKDSGQFGFALRYFSEALGNTEFGVYAMNIHSREPMASGILNNVDEETIGEAAADNYTASLNLTAPPTAEQIAAITAVGEAAGGFAVLTSSKYFIDYPEDIQLYGLSFSTNIGSMAVSGEISHKVDSPIQMNATQLISATLQGGTASLAVLGMTANELDADVAAVAEGGVVQGYRLFDISQAQVTAIKFFDQVAGSSRVTLIAEAGYTFVHDLKEGEGEIRYERASIFSEPGNSKGFVTESSYSYRTRVVAEYSDVFAGVNLTPTLAWRHDVKGFSPQSSGAFQEGHQSIGLTLQADYLSTYNASISYTQYMGGNYSLVSDHDFASISVGMQF